MLANALQFSTEDLDLFSVASGDRNPLHLSAEYGRRSAFGSQVVFGVLGGLAGLGLLAARPARCVRSLVLEFPNAMLPGVPYRGEVLEDRPERSAFKLTDGKRLLVRGTLQAEEGGTAPTRWPELPAGAAEEPSHLHLADLVAGLQVEAEYRPDWASLEKLAVRWGLKASGWQAEQLACLIGCSYLIGMRLPGRQALFSRLALRFEKENPRGPLGFSARLVGVDARFDLLSIQVTWTAGGQPLARADLQAFFRQELASASLDELRSLLPPEPKLLGRSALVVGASRGLGAALTQALILQGAGVIATYQRSRAQAEQLAATCSEGPGRLLTRQGDAADPEFLQSLRDELQKTEGGLDLLLCNACPPLLPLWLEPASAKRIVEHVTSAVALVTAPLAIFLDSLAARAGRCAILSSSAVTAPPADWPHYVSAKHALEGLAQVAALEFGQVGFLVVRPPRLLTDLTNTPLGRQTALPPARVAAAIVQRLISPHPSAGQVDLLESF